MIVPFFHNSHFLLSCYISSTFSHYLSNVSYVAILLTVLLSIASIPIVNHCNYIQCVASH